jgi:hypothetical protein
MRDLKQRLIDGDPVAREAELDALDAQAMRRQIVTAARNQSGTPPLPWRLSSLALAGVVAACLTVAVGIGMRLRSGEVRTPVAAPAVKDNARRQMQFVAPGGTRIIWTFHDEMEL